MLPAVLLASNPVPSPHKHCGLCPIIVPTACEGPSTSKQSKAGSGSSHSQQGRLTRPIAGILSIVRQRRLLLRRPHAGLHLLQLLQQRRGLGIKRWRALAGWCCRRIMSASIGMRAGASWQAAPLRQRSCCQAGGGVPARPAPSCGLLQQLPVRVGVAQIHHFWLRVSIPPPCSPRAAGAAPGTAAARLAPLLKLAPLAVLKQVVAVVILVLLGAWLQGLACGMAGLQRARGGGGWVAGLVSAAHAVHLCNGNGQLGACTCTTPAAGNQALKQNDAALCSKPRGRAGAAEAGRGDRQHWRQQRWHWKQHWRLRLLGRSSSSGGSSS